MGFFGKDNKKVPKGLALPGIGGAAAAAEQEEEVRGLCACVLYGAWYWYSFLTPTRLTTHLRIATGSEFSETEEQGELLPGQKEEK